MDSNPESIAADVLRGTREISRFIGLSERATFSILQRQLVPCWKEGKYWISSRTLLKNHYQGADRAKVASPKRRVDPEQRNSTA
jgi:hypothetical protein